MASFSLEMPVLVAWLGTPLGCWAGPSSMSTAGTAVSVIGGSLLVGRGGGGRGHGRGLAAVAVTVAVVPVTVAVATLVTVAPGARVGVVRLGVVGRLVPPAGAG